MQGGEQPSVIADERLKDGYAYWCRKAAAGKLPRRADVDPCEIPHLLPHIRLVDVVGPGRFRYRLVGSEVRLQHTENPTGRFVDELLSPPLGPHIVGLYEECVRERRPSYVEIEMNLPNRGPRRFSRILYTPLSDDGVAINHILCFHVIVASQPLRPVDVDLWAQPYRELVHVLL